MNLFKTLLAILLVWFVISKIDMRQLPALFDRISVPALVYFIALFMLLTLLKALQYYVLFGEGISYFQILNVVVLQNALSNYLASGAGILSYLAVLRGEHEVKVSRSARIFILIKVADLAAIWLALCLSGIWVWSSIAGFHAIVTSLLVVTGCFLLIFLLMAFFQRDLSSLFGNMAYRLPVSRLPVLRRAAGIFQIPPDMKPGQLGRMFSTAFLLSLLYFAVNIVLIYVNYLVFDFHQDLREVVFVNTLLIIVSYLPVQIFGGLGVTEASALFFWGPFGVSQTELASVLIGMRTLFYLVNLLPLLFLPLYAVQTGKSSALENDRVNRK